MAEIDEGERLHHTPPVRDDMRAQNLSWTIERVGWVLFLLIIGAALIGLFGRGGLSTTEIVDPSGRLSVEYEWIDRATGRSTMTIEARGLPPGGEAELRFSPNFFDDLGIDTIEPPPLRSYADGSGSVRIYPVGPSGTVRTRLEYRAGGFGATERSVSLPGGPAVQFRQYVLP
jgi:hypothetical protein